MPPRHYLIPAISALFEVESVLDLNFVGEIYRRERKERKEGVMEGAGDADPALPCFCVLCAL
jgi:hypothetical protein